MPPDDGSGWENWIIGTLVAMVSTMVTTIVAVVRFIQGQYIKTIEDLQKAVALNSNHLEALNTAAIECFEDRARLKAVVENAERIQAELVKRVTGLERREDPGN